MTWIIRIGLLTAYAAIGLAQLSPEDNKRLNGIMERRSRGEDISAEDRQFAQAAMAKRNQANAARMAEYAKANPARESIGVAPLTEIREYKGEQGGLYPGGANTPPEAHRKAGMTAARAIAPLDAEGRKSADGKIVLLSIGMSNTTMEYQAFMKLAAAETGLHPRLAIVDGAQGGQTGQITANPDSNFWKVVATRLADAGVTAKQVQAIWFKQANAGPTREFPAEAKKLEADIVKTLQNVKAKYPNTRVAYLSNRIYAGFASSPLNPEPHAYETAFSVKWAIARQIAGDAELSLDRVPWIAWGPYIWTDGVKGRADGLKFTREDVGPDGTHPSDSGRAKVARLLLDFLIAEPTARPWFLTPE